MATLLLDSGRRSGRDSGFRDSSAPVNGGRSREPYLARA